MNWVFEQIEGPSSERKKLTLSGWNAPYGRPRKEPVIREVIKSRIQTTRYPGSNKQTRHAFGTNWEDGTELHGRWMTKNLLVYGKTANDVVDEWTAFIKDERTVRMAWGFIVSYTAYIEELEIARESEDEVAWKMKIQIDQRDDTIKRPAPPKAQPIEDNLEFIKTWASFSEKLKAPVLPDISPDLLDQLNNLAAALNGPSAELNKLAGQFDDIEKATYATLQHFRGAISGVETAIDDFRETLLNVDIDSAMLVRSAESDIAWVKYTSDFDLQTMLVLDQLNQMDRKAELAQKQDATKFVTAKEGDSWESISTRATGGPDKAGDIRSLNGVRYGDKPEPGQSYLVQ